MAVGTMETWIDNQQARGKYTFLRQEAVRGSGLRAEAARKALQRLAHRERIVKIKNYFYGIVPLEYRLAGSPPAPWFIHDLMAAMKLPYYVGLLSAAGVHGSSHQQPQEFQVVTDRSVRLIKVARLRIRFFASKHVSSAATLLVKTPTGSMRVATPETTAVDLVRFRKAAGDLDHVATVINELVPRLSTRRLVAAVQLVQDVPDAQRLGFILDRLRARVPADALRGWVDRQSPRTVPLRPNRPGDKARENKRWHLLVNGAIEVEG